MNIRQLNTPDTSTILVVGAYGLIGFGVTKRLLADGYGVVGLGRDDTTAKRVVPGISWVITDLANLCAAADWQPVLEGISAVVNCAGALQDGPADRLDTIHVQAVTGLAIACAKARIPLVQISAAGTGPAASTAFLRTKAQGDAAIKASGARFHIFRPAMVVAQQAYGGSAMLRMLAAVPVMQPIAYPKAQVQTVSLGHIEATVSAAISGKIPDGFEGDLAEQTPHDLQDVVAEIRNWMGFGAARTTIPFPDFGTRLIGQMADGVSRLGWRPPLRTTALRVLQDGVVATPSDLSSFGVPEATALKDTLATLPIGTEARLTARLSLLMPLIMGVLVLFWLSAGVTGILRVNAAALTLEAVGWSHAVAVLSVLFWAVVDIAIALGLAVRKYAAAACWAAVLVSGFYLMASTVFVPQLWLDPLGPLTKVLPSMVLAVVARIGLDGR